MERRTPPNYLPEPRFQLKFVRFLFLGSLVQVALLCAVLFYFVGETHRVLEANGGIDPRAWPLLQRQLVTLIALLAVVFFLYLSAVAAIGLFYSHRIGGVIFAIKRTLNDLDAGRYPTLKLRRNDEFQDVTDAFNRFVSKLRAADERDGVGAQNGSTLEPAQKRH